MKLSNRVTIMIIVLVLVSSSLSAQEAKKSELPAYLLTAFIGYGAGHFYLGADNAINFVLLDALGLAVEIGGAIYMYSSSADLYLEGLYTGTIVMYVGVAIIAAARIYEIIDIIMTVEKMKADGKIARLEPKITPTSDGISVSLAYKL